MPSDPTKMKQKDPTAVKNWPAETATIPSTPTLVVTPSCTTVLKRTMATASFRTDSPKIRELSLGSAPVELEAVVGRGGDQMLGGGAGWPGSSGGDGTVAVATVVAAAGVVAAATAQEVDAKAGVEAEPEARGGGGGGGS